jgi:hypothetical protein
MPLPPPPIGRRTIIAVDGIIDLPSSNADARLHGNDRLRSRAGRRAGLMIAATSRGWQVTQSADLIAIIRSGETASAVWHVDVAPSTPLMRLCGAWVTDDADVLRKVLAGRVILPFGGRLEADATDLAQATVGVVDLNATLSMISEVIADLDEKHRAAKTAAGNPRAPIRWPELPEPLDWTALPAAPRGVNPEPFVAETLAVARWVADLAEAWSSVETSRTSKEHLTDGDLKLRLLPVDLTVP